ncbi:hypothetical protein M422DRAFT_62279 [Sphaerobolus stellatus SS14]|uniref:adenosine deaminase n=1 Tax=Sphaerobolus stellatus (strain SS14) TaxID=990650 RepID=A0A0C9T8A0_SPHS4|nr:hypothetical protein M422DRAFT_62279 [Sphaerobolus stellatus SS14]
MSTSEDYLKLRQTIIQKDRLLRRENYPRTPLTPKESQAESFLRQLRAQEAVRFWKEGKDGVHLFPGMEFLTAKSIIDRTSLFKIIRRMPKGALLHIHLGASVKASALLDIALEHPELHIRTSETLKSDRETQPLPDFRPFSSRQGSITDLSSSDYLPNTWVPLQEARASCSLGVAEFDAWIISSLTINPTEAYGTHNTVSKIWKKFQSTFDVSEGILSFFPIWKRYFRELFQSSMEDGIMYIESSYNFPTIFQPDCVTRVSNAEFLQLFDEVINEVKMEMKKQGREGHFQGAKIIYSCMRTMTAKDLDTSLDKCIQLKQAFPHLISGITLVGDENALQPLTYYLESLLRFKQKQVDLNLDIPFFFHAGETLGDGDRADDNLYDAILLGTKRIGHGFSLPKHPFLLEMCREKQIAIEVCPISNEVLRLTTSMPMHPLPVFINHGIPVVIGSDDPAVFGNMGLSYDFYQIFVSSEICNLSTLKALASDSITTFYSSPL